MPLDDDEIYQKIFSMREPVEFTVNYRFCDLNDRQSALTYLFKSVSTPIQPGLCFWTAEHDEDTPETISGYSLQRIFGESSFASAQLNEFEICPYGTFNVANRDRQCNRTVPYTVLINDNVVQSYGVTRAQQITNLGSRNTPSKQYKEIGNPRYTGGWDCGHCVDFADTPYAAGKSLSAFAFRENLVPELPHWNRFQRNPLVKRIRKNGGGYYAIFPTYYFNPVHKRHIKYEGKLIPDGELVRAATFNAKIATQYQFIPFLNFTDPELRTNYDIASTVADYKTHSCKTKLDRAIQVHKAPPSAIPSAIVLDPEVVPKFDDALLEYTDDFAAYRNNYAAMALTLNDVTRAATMEYKSPRNKIQAAIIYSKIQDDHAAASYIKAIKQHADVLLDDCEAEGAGYLSEVKIRDFKKYFPDEDETYDSLARLRRAYGS